MRDSGLETKPVNSEFIQVAKALFIKAIGSKINKTDME